MLAKICCDIRQHLNSKLEFHTRAHAHFSEQCTTSGRTGESLAVASVPGHYQYPVQGSRRRRSIRFTWAPRPPRPLPCRFRHRPLQASAFFLAKITALSHCENHQAGTYNRNCKCDYWVGYDRNREEVPLQNLNLVLEKHTNLLVRWENGSDLE